MSTDVTLYDEVVLKAPTGGGDFPQHPAKPAITTARRRRPL